MVTSSANWRLRCYKRVEAINATDCYKYGFSQSKSEYKGRKEIKENDGVRFADFLKEAMNNVSYI